MDPSWLWLIVPSSIAVGVIGVLGAWTIWLGKILDNWW